MSLGKYEEEAIILARAQLEAADIWDPEGDLNSLVDRFIVRSDKQRALNEFTLAVSERCSRIPLGHILGTVEFDELQLVIGSGVFIPRPHSIVIHKWLDGTELATGTRVLDLCAGSGAIGLAIARRRPDLNVTCVEFEEVAFSYLKRNINRLSTKQMHIDALQADVRDKNAFAHLSHKVGLIVANPPYVPQHIQLQPEWSEHHPTTAVYSGTDGLDLTRQITALAIMLLTPDGWLVIEHGEDQANAIRDLFEKYQLTEVRTVIDRDASDITGRSVMTVGRLLNNVR
ncbi:peptide chain release factor N(5)-glutamine methyltransferase [Pseudomonas nabeulensis]|uniref:peptide chain release factor N(5)-glutamine methyltransferase n=1 Tax=Pseudomonas nabeulensis TaxID=2293833 RepID=A0A4Z0AU26_9PSED|nr:HemK/PrmC family methyltransferase [Pseudomonas nabeulensis]TFY89669.1 peptide chain release factor N(5)-glutamine methyltransferase [Pseudomonas nabeulensis]